MRIEGSWLRDPATQAVFDCLEGGGHRALLVGGCVRDAVLGRPVGDIDIATDALPDRVIALARAAGLRAVPTGAEHGTVTVVSGHRPFEVTTFRRDMETDGRHARVLFGTDLREDAARRDFTMNALYADRRGHVIDPLGGLDDLQAGRVRFIGDPAERLREDRLRLLRFFRFLAHFSPEEAAPDADGLAACAAAVNGLDRLSRERVGAEMRKLLCAPSPVTALRAMQGIGALARILPESCAGEAASAGGTGDVAADPSRPEDRASATRRDGATVGQRANGTQARDERGGAATRLTAGTEAEADTGSGAADRVAALVRVERATGAAPAWQRRLVALCPAGDATDALRLSRRESRYHSLLRRALAAGQDPRALANREGADAGRDLCLLSHALGGTVPALGELDAIEHAAAAVFPVRAADLAPLSGPALGRRLQELHARWIASDCRLGREELLHS